MKTQEAIRFKSNVQQANKRRKKKIYRLIGASCGVNSAAMCFGLYTHRQANVKKKKKSLAEPFLENKSFFLWSDSTFAGIF